MQPTFRCPWLPRKVALCVRQPPTVGRGRSCPRVPHQFRVLVQKLLSARETNTPVPTTPCTPMHLTGPNYTHSTLSPTALPLNPTGPPLREGTARTPWDSGILLPLTDEHPRNRLHRTRLPCDARVHPILCHTCGAHPAPKMSFGIDVWGLAQPMDMASRGIKNWDPGKGNQLLRLAAAKADRRTQGSMLWPLFADGETESQRSPVPA
ncbi:hypothetical protein MJT46_015712 [Ovis ammon polii x Ovis aries]|nr:hypothetical protein MJT46_015712 [Ovis ammon polii x Ovis aries]